MYPVAVAIEWQRLASPSTPWNGFNRKTKTPDEFHLSIKVDLLPGFGIRNGSADKHGWTCVKWKRLGVNFHIHHREIEELLIRVKGAFVFSSFVRRSLDHGLLDSVQ